MKHLNKIQTLLFILPLLLMLVSSCKKISEDPAIAKALVGFWRINDGSAETTVEGVDFIAYVTDHFGLTESEAREILDDILQNNLQSLTGTMILNGDRTCQLNISNQGEEPATWSVSADGDTLSLFFGGEEDQLLILTLDANAMQLQLPVQYVDADIDGDGISETLLEIVRKIGLAKAVGGAGS